MRPIALVAGMLACLALPAGATIHRDPLTEAETDQLREAAQDPPLKLKLLLKFTRQRLDSAQALRLDPKAGPDHGQTIHDLLEDFGSLVDELGDNLEAYAARKEDLRKPLAEIIAASTDFAARLQDFKAAAAANPREARAYSFALADAIDAVDSGRQNAQELLQEQQEQFKKRK
jgi:hypothetical protein